MTSLYAISDLHLAYERNRQALLALPAYPDDWLIVAGDVGESEAHLTLALDILTQRFARVLWTPGNHELWTLPGETLRGEAKYQRLVALCNRWASPHRKTLILPGTTMAYTVCWRRSLCSTTIAFARRIFHWKKRWPGPKNGHLHIRNSQLRDGVRFEEVSLGYPQQWQATRGIAGYLRKVW